MRPFLYEKPANEAAALQNASVADASVIAGGTGMVDLMRLGVIQPGALVDVNGLPWNQVDRIENGALRIGALVRNSDLAYHPDVLSKFPGLSEALLSGASPQLRNMATVGGNLLQRTRCSYFREPAIENCNKRTPGSGCAAMDGISRMMAILGTSDACIAANPSDMCVALTAMDAVIHVKGPKGERDIPIADFHVVPGAHPEIESVLAHGELVAYVTVIPTPMSAKSVYVKARDRASFAFALASACIAIDVQNNVVRDVRVALGGVGTKPWRSVDAENEIRGKAPSPDLWETCRGRGAERREAAAAQSIQSGARQTNDDAGAREGNRMSTPTVGTGNRPPGRKAQSAGEGRISL